jgi:hypothetical protein
MPAKYVVWKSKRVGNACLLEQIENVDNLLSLYTGGCFEGRLPANAQFRMSKDFKKDTGLIDDVKAGGNVKVCSARLVDFLRKQKLKNVEFLPVTILDHKGKVASKEYSVVNPFGLQDALDLEESEPDYNAIRPTDIDEVEQIVLDTSRIERGVKLFRLKGLTTPVLMEKGLADAITEEGFVGPLFLPPEKVKW